MLWAISVRWECNLKKKTYRWVIINDFPHTIKHFYQLCSKIESVTLDSVPIFESSFPFYEIFNMSAYETLPFLTRTISWKTYCSYESSLRVENRCTLYPWLNLWNFSENLKRNKIFSLCLSVLKLILHPYCIETCEISSVENKQS